MRSKGWEGKEQVFRAASDDSEVFREGGSDRMDLLGSFLVCEGRDKGSCNESGFMVLVT